MKQKHMLLLPLFLIVLITFSCDSDSDDSGGNIGPLPANPNDWLCPDSVINLTQQEIDEWCSLNMDRGEPAPPFLRIPSPLADLEAKNRFDERFEEFLRSRTYDFGLGWNSDLSWRMTGPYVGSIGTGKFFGVHSSAVHIYYSPEIIEWLCNNREGPIPDGAIIIKEQHPIDESLGIVTDSEGCMDVTASNISPTHWTVFIKNAEAAKDGWYWGSFRADPEIFPIPEWQVGNPLSLIALLSQAIISSWMDMSPKSAIHYGIQLDMFLWKTINSPMWFGLTINMETGASIVMLPRRKNLHSRR